jgi:O-antigen/teichoic acid export membrane protein
MSLVAYFERFPLFRNYVLPLIASPIRRRLARGAVWGGVGAIASRGIAVASAFVLARILGQQGFGEYGMVNSTAGMMGGIAGLGIGSTVTKYVAELKSSDPERASRILALASAVMFFSAMLYAVFFMGFAPWLASKTLAAPHLTDALRISAITVSLSVVNSVQSCSLAGCEAFRDNSIIATIASILQSILVVIGAWFGGVGGAVTGMAAGMVVTVYLTRRVVRGEWRKYALYLNWRGMSQEWRVLVHYSLPTFLIFVLMGPVPWLTNTMLAHQPNGYSELGVLNAAVQWQGAIQFLPGIVCTAMIPVMSEKCGQGDILGSLRVMMGMVKGVALIAIPLAVCLCLLSPVIMSGYGETFAQGYWTMVFLVLTGMLSAIMIPIGNFVMASGLVWKSLFFNIGWIIAMLVASWCLVHLGANGLALARLIAAVVHAVLTSFFLVYVYSKAKKH